MNFSRLLDLGMRFVRHLRIPRQAICLASWHGMRRTVDGGTFGGYHLLGRLGALVVGSVVETVGGVLFMYIHAFCGGLVKYLTE